MDFIPLPDVAYLRECFTYDPETGFLAWRQRPQEHFPDAWERECRRWNARYANKPAGGIMGGYRVAQIDGRTYQVHRIIWTLQTGAPPREEIDHINRNRVDNRWINLREATHGQNMTNRPNASKTSGLPRGVYRRLNGRYAANAKNADGRLVHLGVHATPEEARTAYVTFVREIQGEFFLE